MHLIQTTIEFFIYQGALSLIITALLMLIYVIYQISKLNSVNEYKAGKYAIVWFVISFPQIIGLLVAEEYKEYLPIHAIELTEESCKLYLKENVTKDQKCILNGRILEDQINTYLLKVNGQKLSINKCDILLMRSREFLEYRGQFEQLFESISIYDVLL